MDEQEAEDSFIGRLAMTPDTPPPIAEQALRGELRAGMVGLVLGILLILAGCIWCFLGVSGSVEWEFRAGGMLDSRLVTASPGVLLMVVGFFVIVFTRPKVLIAKK